MMLYLKKEGVVILSTVRIQSTICENTAIAKREKSCAHEYDYVADY